MEKLSGVTMPIDIRGFAAFLVTVVAASATPTAEPLAQEVIVGSPGERVVASWYGDRYRGRPTASGEVFDPSRLTAAHPSFPFGTLVEVRNPDDGRRVVVRVNDRGPANGRGIDLSEAAARRIGLIEQGVADVVLHAIEDAGGWQ